MFKKICIKDKVTTSSSLDISYLIDSMLYYGKVILLVHRNDMHVLFQSLGKDLIKELVESGRLELRFKNNQLGTIIAPEGKYGISTFSGQDITAHSTLYQIDRLTTRNSINNSKFADEFSNFFSNYEYPKDFNEVIVSDFGNTDLIKKQISAYFNKVAPTYKLPELIDIDIVKEGNFIGVDTYKIESNINLDEITKELKKNDPSIKYDVDFSGFLLAVAESKGDIYISSDLESEIVTSDLYSKFIEIELSEIITKRKKSESELNLFENYVLEDCYSLGTAFTNGIISSKELLKILEKSDKFRDWLDKIPEDKNLLGEYNKAVLEKDFSDKIPTKTARFVILESIGLGLDVLGAGGLGSVAAIALGSFDTFILDKLINRKWKPNQFIDNTLKPKIKI